MTRLPDINRDSMEPEGQRIWDKISTTRGGMSGPYGVLIRVPKLAEKMAELGDYFRHDSLLSGADRELAILAAAREIGSRYEWLRHEKVARECGTRAEAIECLRSMTFNKLTDRETVIIEVVQSLFRTRSVPPSLYDKALNHLGEDKLVELVTLAGFYCSIAFTIMAFEVALPEGMKAPF
jgi:4-carboxymuconolactone decarboxylase